MFGMDDRMASFMGFRNMLCEEKIEDCLAQAKQGYTNISFDAEDLTKEEIEYIKSEVQRRVRNGQY
ncbi:MAG: hypothetical protein K5756_05005 [Clostridiales bacterium]|nr:hypothetical protein [Clostridiales bacterium]